MQVQSIVYGLGLKEIERTLESLSRGFELAHTDGVLKSLRFFMGDTSSERCISDIDLDSLRRRFGDAIEIDYHFFNKNVGSAAGHNYLAEHAESDYLMILNPDVVVSPRLLQRMIAPFESRSVGMTEAKQLPIEHPKDYDPRTGETSWATTACAVTPTDFFRELQGFDSDTFFLYCDDVDYSWRVREAGKKVIFLPDAIAFHDKRLGQSGAWKPSSAEIYYSAQASLLMAYKWSNQKLLNKLLSLYESGPEHERAAFEYFRKKQESNALPEPRDKSNRIATFEGFMYAKHRYAL
ncbi:glycosyltransferase [Martelella sp. FLE1502]